VFVRTSIYEMPESVLFSKFIKNDMKMVVDRLTNGRGEVMVSVSVTCNPIEKYGDLLVAPTTKAQGLVAEERVFHYIGIEQEDYNAEHRQERDAILRSDKRGIMLTNERLRQLIVARWQETKETNLTDYDVFVGTMMTKDCKKDGATTSIHKQVVARLGPSHNMRRVSDARDVAVRHSPRRQALLGRRDGIAAPHWCAQETAHCTFIVVG
jgi:hypothetical protein